MNGAGSSSAGPSSSELHLSNEEMAALYDIDSPDSAAGNLGFEPPPEEWEEVGAKKKAKKMEAAAKKKPAAPPAVASPPAAAAPASSSTKSSGKKPAGSGSSAAAPPPSSPSKSKSDGKKAASPPSVPSAVTANSGGGNSNPPSPSRAERLSNQSSNPPSPDAKKGTNGKEKKKPGVLPKAELQSRCEALLAATSPEAGFMLIEKLEATLGADAGFTSWEDKYAKAHGPLRNFLKSCPKLSVATVSGEERVYLNKMLDEEARQAIAAEKASKTTPRKRKGGRNGMGGCCSMLCRPGVFIFLIGVVAAALVAAAIALVPSQEWSGAMEAARRGDAEVTLAFIKRAANTVYKEGEARAEPYLTPLIEEGTELATRWYAVASEAVNAALQGKAAEPAAEAATESPTE